MIVIGLTGSLASGKTTVAGMFRRRSVVYIDADRLAHNALRKGTACYRQLLKSFGSRIVDKNGEISRKELAAVGFRTEKNQRRLCSIIHPQVFRDIENKIKACKKRRSLKAMVVEAVLLIESGLYRRMDYIVLVRASRGQQLARVLSNRGMSLSEARRRMRFQMPFCEKEGYADFIVDNRGSLENTRRQVEDILKTALSKKR